MKILHKFQEIEEKIKQALGSRFTYFLIVLAIIGCYSISYAVGKVVF